MTCGIYRILNTVNGKSYLGSGVSIERRFRDHKRGLKAGTHCNRKLQRAWAKYGPDAFEFLVVEVVPDASLLTVVETRYIQSEELATSNGGYNICRIGRNHLGVIRDPSVGQKISAAQKGKVMSEEARLNMSLAHKGKPCRPALKALLTGRKMPPGFSERISAALRARPPISDETRARLSASNMGQKPSDDSRAKMARSALGNTSAFGHRKSESYKDQLSCKTRRLTDDQVLWIRQQRLLGVIRPILAAALGVSNGTVRNAELKGYRNGDLSIINHN